MHEGIYYDNGKQARVGAMREAGQHIYYSDSYPSDKNLRESVELRGETLAFFDKIFSSREKLIKQCANSNKMYCDVNPYGHFLIRYIYNKHPDAYFIHIIRDGYDVVNSYHLREKTTYPTEIPEHKYRGYQSGKPRPLIGDKWFNKWNDFDRVQKISWFWQKVNLDIYNNMQVVPENKRILLKLEDLNAENFQELLSRIECSGSYDSKILLKKYNNSNTKLSWTRDNVLKFNKIATPAMKKFEYKIRKT
jgi:hypothetical protein